MATDIFLYTMIWYLLRSCAKAARDDGSKNLAEVFIGYSYGSLTVAGILCVGYMLVWLVRSF